MGARLLEITDLLWPVDAGGALVPVAKADVLNRLRACGQDRAVRIVSAFPDADGFLDPAYIDALGLRVHRELRRLGEELQFGRRVGLSAVAVLAVEPPAGRLWYARNQPGPAG